MDRDFYLVRKMKDGSQEAMEEFVGKYYPEILRYCGYRLADRETAEDLTQETFEKFFRTLSNYRHYGKALNYLYVIAGNLCRDSYRGPVEAAMEELPEMGENPLGEVEERMDMEQAIRSLPEELREVVALRYIQELRLREIAEILDIGLPLVKYRVRRAKELLSELLGYSGTE